MLPQTLPSLIAYSLYSFECCVRAASVLGLVGAGGIGYEIGVSMRLFEYGQVLTLILAFIALMAITDGMSRIIRGRMAPGARPVPRLGGLAYFIIPIGILIGLSLSFYFSGFTPDVLEQENVIHHAVRFISAMVPPDVQPVFVSRMG